MISPSPLAAVERWYHERAWQPKPFQRELWRAYMQRQSGLLCAPCSSGKTLAALFCPLIESAQLVDSAQTHLLWICPDALSAQRFANLLAGIIREWRLRWTIEQPVAANGQLATRQRIRNPTVLIATPETAELMLTRAESQSRLAHLSTVVVDDWHRLLSDRRSVQIELFLAHLRGWRNDLRVWGLSSLTDHQRTAMATLIGTHDGRLIEAERDIPLEIRSLLPAGEERFPWPGHLGRKLAAEAARTISAEASTLICARSHEIAEAWRSAIAGELPHARLEIGEFSQQNEAEPVLAEQVVAIWPGFAEFRDLLQRLPERCARLIGLPEQAWDLVRFAAAQIHLNDQQEARRGAPLDVLLRFILACSVGGGFVPEALLALVRSTITFRELTESEWSSLLALATPYRSRSTPPEVLAITSRIRTRRLRNALIEPLPKKRFAATRESESIGRIFQEFRDERPGSVDMQALQPILDIQRSWSGLPGLDGLLVEMTRVDSSYHLALFPLAGSGIHQGIATLIAARLQLDRALSPSIAIDDFGIGLTFIDEAGLDEASWRVLLAPDGIENELLASADLSEEIAQRARDFLSRAGLPDSIELAEDDPITIQARREVLDEHHHLDGVAETLLHVARGPIHLVETTRLTPLAFPLWAEHLRQTGQADEIQLTALQLELRAEKDEEGSRAPRAPRA